MQTPTRVATSSQVKRFTVAERSLHWTIASAVIFNLTTGLFIWQSWDDLFKIGHFNPVSQAHFWLGGGAIILAGLVFLALRRDRIAAADKRMNPQQVLNLRAIQILLLYMATSGVLMKFGRNLGISKHVHHLIGKSHLIVAATILASICVHLFMVLLYPKNRGVVSGMVSGTVDRETARRVWPWWVDSPGVE